ncbi:MAG: dgoA protein [Planctomycetales bacterium]|nr:dgoA protein [Planctomycetales bacterium]
MNSLTRRRFLAATAAAMFTRETMERVRAEGTAISAKHLRVTDVQRTTATFEYRPTPRRNMDRELPHWRFAEICEVKLECGVTGIGETLLYYTWGVPSDENVKSVIGKNAMSVMWDDDLGAGLQMALFDAVARALDAPIHHLLGQKVHDRTPLSWWNIDTSAADMVAECREAHRLGYMSYKTKGRPWFDVWKQVGDSAQAMPAAFKIDMDFNDTLLTAKQGMQIIKDLEKFPQVDIYETPIPQSDVEGNRQICEATRVNVAMHYGKPSPATCVETKCCDGFVVGHGATELMAAGRFCEQVEMPFWLQLVGTGVTAAWSLQFGGVLEQAVWPAVNCHQLYEENSLTQPIVVQNGHAVVPDGPGLGFELNRDRLNQRKVPRPPSRPEPRRLIETSWPDGSSMYTASNGQVNFMLTAGQQGRYPYFLRGADTRLVPDDGTSRWRELYERARKEGPIQA